MPDPLPEFSPPRRLTLSSARTESTARPNRWLLKSRLLLVAASVALFLGAQFLLPNFMPSSTEKSGHVGDVSNPFAKDPNKDLIKSEAEIEKKLTIQIDDDGAFFKSEANFKDPGKK